MVRGNFKARRARLTEKKKRQWLAREKLMIIEKVTVSVQLQINLE